MIRCPQWSRLLEHRFDSQVEEPEDWSAGLEHLDSCEACRLEAFDLDPTLAFLNLPAIEVSDAEVQSIQQAVMTLRQGLVIAEKDSSSELVIVANPRRLWSRSQRKLAAWAQSQWRIAAAVALTAGLGLASLGNGGALWDRPAETPDEASLQQPAPFEGQVNGDSAAHLTSESGVMPAAWQAAPIVEAVGSPAARVYSYPQAEEDTMTLVMIIDPEIEV